MNNTKVNELANNTLESGNPYILKAVRFFIDAEEHYIYADEIMNKEQIDKAYLKTAIHDIKYGYKERMVGYYDKWFRYTRADEGRAYDLGVKLALENPKCCENMHIIECRA